MDTRNKINRKISVAPMMDCTDRHDRYFLRLMSKNVMLYSEMVATKSAIHGDRKKILSFSPEEKPLALQVGGSNKEELSEVAKIAEDMGYERAQRVGLGLKYGNLCNYLAMQGFTVVIATISLFRYNCILSLFLVSFIYPLYLVPSFYVFLHFSFHLHRYLHNHLLVLLLIFL